MIKEMAKEIARILFEDCLLNIGGSCADCEWNGKETKEYDCQSLLVAKKLLEKYQPKIPEGAVVIDKNENPCLSCPVPEDIQRDVDCSTICGAVRLGIDWQNQCKVLVKENKQLTKELAEKGKKTAREICGMLDVLDASYKQKGLALSKLKEWIKKNYDLEIK